LVMFGALVVFIFAIILLMPWNNRKLQLIIAGIGIVVGLLILMAAAASLASQELPETTPTPVPEVSPIAQEVEEDPPFAPEEGIDLAPQTFEEPPVSPWVSFLLSLSIVLVIFAIVWFVWRANSKPADQRAAFADLAEQAVDEIKAGEDWGDAILNCYAGMLDAVYATRKIPQKQTSLTPAEFVALMVKEKMPAEPVERLTRLFERVRYGGKKATQREIDEAIACLNDIIAASRSEA
jgi:hypothetical protein